jgi:hypothetical protein
MPTARTDGAIRSLSRAELRDESRVSRIVAHQSILLTTPKIVDERRSLRALALIMLGSLAAIVLALAWARGML